MKVGDLVRIWYDGESTVLSRRGYLEKHGYIWTITKIEGGKFDGYIGIKSLASGFEDRWWWRRSRDGMCAGGMGISMTAETSDEIQEG